MKIFLFYFEIAIKITGSAQNHRVGRVSGNTPIYFRHYCIAIIWRPSVVVVPPSSIISNHFFSETAWPIKNKFYVEIPWVGD